MREMLRNVAPFTSILAVVSGSIHYQFMFLEKIITHKVKPLSPFLAHNANDTQV